MHAKLSSFVNLHALIIAVASKHAIIRGASPSVSFSVVNFDINAAI